jgi:adenylate kinase family enzyme
MPRAGDEIDDQLALLAGAPPRIAVIGNAGAGKSTLARTLQARTGADRLDLDGLYWERGRSAVRRPIEAARGDVTAFCDARATWIVEGCYADLVEPLLARRPLLLWLDPPLEACLRHCRERPWVPHKFASAAEQDARLDALLAWVQDYETREGELSRAGHDALFRAYRGPKRHLREEFRA